MKKIIMVILCVATVSLVMGQQATKAGWIAFNQFTQQMESTSSAARQLYNEYSSLLGTKNEITGNATLLAEVQKVIDVHPDYTLPQLIAKLNALEDVVKNMLKAGVLVDNLQTVSATEGGYVYVGYTIHGVKPNEADWAIKRSPEWDSETGSPSWSWADGAKEFNYKWTDRAGLSY